MPDQPRPRLGPGRPPRGGVRATRLIQIKVTDTEFAAIKKMAADNRQPVTTVIREAVNTYVADYGEESVFLILEGGC